MSHKKKLTAIIGQLILVCAIAIYYFIKRKREKFSGTETAITNTPREKMFIALATSVAKGQQLKLARGQAAILNESGIIYANVDGTVQVFPKGVLERIINDKVVTIVKDPTMIQPTPQLISSPPQLISSPPQLISSPPQLISSEKSFIMPPSPPVMVRSQTNPVMTPIMSQPIDSRTEIKSSTPSKADMYAANNTQLIEIKSSTPSSNGLADVLNGNSVYCSFGNNNPGSISVSGESMMSCGLKLSNLVSERMPRELSDAINKTNVVCSASNNGKYSCGLRKI